MIIKLADNKVWLLRITSKYLNKSKYIRKYYYPIFDWKKYGLDKESYIDTRNYLIYKTSNLNISKIRGHFSIKDMKNLQKFILKNAIEDEK